MSAMETGDHMPEGDVDANHWLPYADEAYANAAGFLPTLLAGIREGAEKKDWNRSVNPFLVPSACDQIASLLSVFSPQVLFDFPLWGMTAVALYHCANDERGDVPPEMDMQRRHARDWTCPQASEEERTRTSEVFGPEAPPASGPEGRGCQDPLPCHYHGEGTGPKLAADLCEPGTLPFFRALSLLYLSMCACVCAYNRHIRMCTFPIIGMGLQCPARVLGGTGLPHVG